MTTKTDLYRLIDELPDDVIARVEQDIPVMLVMRQDGGRPVLHEIDPEQWWFWTPGWQAAVREAQEDIAAGRVTHHDSDEAFLAHLDSMPPASE